MDLFYFDTSVWLDFFEDRDEPGFPKGRWAQELVQKIIRDNGKIIYSDVNVVELEVVGYSSYDLDILFQKLKQILIFVESDDKQMGRAKDIAAKRKIPKGDALHALLAKESKAVLVTFDRHFQKLRDIAEIAKTSELI